MQFQTLEELDKHFKGLMNAEEDPLKKADIRADYADAKADFKIQQFELKQKAEQEAREAKQREEAAAREQQVRERERQAWIREALVEYPEAKAFQEMVTGETEDEIKASAKSTHERVLVLKPPPAQNNGTSQEEARNRAREAYGAVTGSGGSGTAPNSSEDPDWVFQTEYADKYNNGRLGGQFGNEIMGVSRAETDKYVAKRGGSHLFEQLKRVQEMKYGKDSPLVSRPA